MEANLESGDANPTDFAYLTDRVLVAKKQPQVYGTQGDCTGPGVWTPAPLVDPEQIDARRASVGLGPLEDYRAGFKDICPGSDP